MTSVKLMYDLTAERNRLEAENADLRRQLSRKWMCAYCGEVFELGSMASWHAEVGKHMAGCKKAPIMRLAYATEALKKVATYARHLRRQLSEARAGQAEQYRAAHEAERQLAEARAEAERVRGLWRNLMKAAGEDQCHMRAMEAIEANAKDAERLDWLEKHVNSLDCAGYGSDDVWWTLLYCDGNRQEGASARAAIDAAKEPK